LCKGPGGAKATRVQKQKHAEIALADQADTIELEKWDEGLRQHTYWNNHVVSSVKQIKKKTSLYFCWAVPGLNNQNYISAPLQLLIPT